MFLSNIPLIDFCSELTLFGHLYPWLKIINIFLSQYCVQKYLVHIRPKFDIEDAI